ncbi:hypothetical protein CYMTET_54587 [Cymbomonas tetramitiformis]|uniref:Uncharacterized protein n=1 Tax=Cymbomonas tetramitiformis TaxID=36881 RepID=A0AAE0BEV0_9CHLO|nr:hypothetical protein CYMTET_54587 [Cymbomonas tetramitiformis]
MKKEVLDSQQIPWDTRDIHWSHWILATSSDALWSQFQRVMEAKNKGLLDEQEDQTVDEMETTTATVGDSRRSSRQRKRPSASKAELNLNEISGSSRDVTKAPIYSETLPKGFYDNWAPLTDSQTENLIPLVDKLIDRTLTLDELKAQISYLKGLDFIQESLLYLAEEAHDFHASNTALKTESPAFKKL